MKYLSNIRQAVDEKLDALLPGEAVQPRRLHQAMRYSVFSGGKRLRPALCIASCEALSGSIDDALTSACAIEILHTYTLIHDDLPAMDDDDMRRGKPSLHKAFDEATAILAGDALLTLAFAALSLQEHPNIARCLAYHAGSLGIIGGQQDDLMAKDSNPTPQEIASIHARKTAALFSASCAIGAMCARGSEEDVENLGKFGQSLGMAFQLFDDVADSDPVTMGVLGMREALRQAHAYEREAYEVLDRVSGDTKLLRGLAEQVISSFSV